MLLSSSAALADGQLAQPRVLRTIPTKVAPTQVEFSPDGKTPAVGHEDGTVTRWEVDSGQALGVLAGYCKALAARH
jgi:hypothetical protein